MGPGDRRARLPPGPVPRFLQLLDLRTQFGGNPSFDDLDFMSAGLPRADLTRDRRDL